MASTEAYYYDPVQRVIDWQLRSRSVPADKLSCGGQPNYAAIKEDLENRLLGAIEASMVPLVREYRMFLMHCDGYTQTEIGSWFRLQQPAVSRIIAAMNKIVRKVSLKK